MKPAHICKCYTGRNTSAMDQLYVKIIGMTAGILTAMSLLPQLVKTIRTKQAEDVSSYVFIILIAGTGLWAIYGLLREDYPVMITNGLSLALNITMLVLSKKYSPN